MERGLVRADQSEGKAAMREFHTFTFFLPRRVDRPLKVFQQRDLAAAMELLPALSRMGYGYGEPILNFPPETPLVAGQRGQAPHPVDLAFVERGDLILQTTRPPMHDEEEGDRKRVERADTDLERWLFHLWGRYLDRCARSHVRLRKSLHPQLPKGYETRRDMAFREAIGAPYKELNDCAGSGWRKKPKGERRTAVFLLHLEEAWKGGPGFLGVFGMDGTATLAWAHLLGRDLADLLEEPGFVFAEMKKADIPARPTNLRWVSEWKVKVLVRRRPRRRPEKTSRDETSLRPKAAVAPIPIAPPRR